jgi:sugar lactone lactonase YvrE
VAGAAVPIVRPIRGHVSDLPRRTQATIGQIGTGATVSLIDTGTNNTVATTLTDASGNFILTFATSFRPVPGRVYYLEAVKGLLSGGQANMAGVDAARIRTLIQYQNGWISLTSASPDSPLNIGQTTTAVSVIASLRSAFNPVNYAQLIGSVSGTTFTPAGGIAASEFNQVNALVQTALTVDIDPVYYVLYDQGSGNYVAQPRGLLVSSINPASGSFGATITITGSGFGASPSVRFNGLLGVATTINGPQTQITTRVPAGATSGPLTIQIGTLIFGPANFAVVNWDGHNCFDAANNLYLSGNGDGSIYQLTPAGSLSLFVRDPSLNKPNGLCLDSAGNLYVANQVNNVITKITPQKVLSTYASGGGLSTPAGVCLDASGSLYVANSGANTILKVPPGGGTPTFFANVSGNPDKLAIAPDGSLWVCPYNGNYVYRVSSSGVVTQASNVNFSGGLQGIAFDSGGNAYVADRGGNRVARIASTGDVSTFATVSNPPGGLAMRTDGVLYVASSWGWIEAFAPNGGPNGGLFQAVTSYGHRGSSIKVDNNRNLLMTAGFGDGANTQSVYRAPWNAASASYGLFAPLANGLPNPSAVTVDSANNVYVGDWADGVYRINAGGGSPYKYLTGFQQVAGLTFDGNGKLYVSATQGGNNGVYRFNGSTQEKAYGFYNSGGNNLRDICADSSGNFYIADARFGRILRFTPNGDLSAYQTGFNDPEGVTVGPDGSVYVAEYGNNRIQRIDKNTLAVTTWASGTPNPEGIAFDATGSLYVSNQDGSNQVQRVPPGGGTPIVYATNIPGPWGMTVDTSGNLYVASDTNGSVFRVPAGSTPPFNASGATFGTGVAPNDVAPRRLVYKASVNQVFLTADSTSRLFAIPPAGGNWLQVYSGNFWTGGLCLGTDGNFYAADSGGWPGIYRITYPAYAGSVVAEQPVGPGQLAIDPTNRYLYVAEYDFDNVLRIDTQTDTFHVMTGYQGTPIRGIAFNPVDQRLYFQPDGGLTQVFTNLTTGTFAAYSGGNNGGREITFDSAGNLYGATWDGANNASVGVVSRIPSGGGAAAPLPGVWINVPVF